MKKTVCIYHGNCLDGFTSAWIVNAALTPFRNLSFIKGAYTEKIDLSLLKDAEVYFVDFSVKHDVMLQIAEIADSVIVLDHHASAERELQNLPDNVTVHFDMERSGAMLTYNHFFPSTSVPELVKIVQDRDLWQFKIASTKAITAYMFMIEQTFDNWHLLSDEVDNGRAIELGEILLKKHDKNVDDIIDGCTREVMFDGHKVNITNAHWMYASDIGHKTIGDNLFSITYFTDNNDRISYSLRANDAIDCSKIAEAHKGGGHPNAAGFSSMLELWDIIPTSKEK